MTPALNAIGYARPAPSLTPVRFPADVFSLIEQWAQQRALEPALLHKQHGRWGLHRWHDVAVRLRHLQAALLREGVGPQSRFAVSGAFEPTLLLLALAAHAAGATVLPIDRNARGQRLQALLRSAAPTHAFVQDRHTISVWLESAPLDSTPVSLYAGQSVRHGNASWQIRPLPDLLGSSAGWHDIGKHKRLRAQAGLWVEEGSEWQDGLAIVLAAWLGNGSTLIAPETTASSARDRHEVAFHTVVASMARVTQWRSERDARRAAPGSWGRRLLDWASRHPGNPLAAVLLGRVERLHGLPEAACRNAGEDA